MSIADSICSDELTSAATKCTDFLVGFYALREGQVDRDDACPAGVQCAGGGVAEAGGCAGDDSYDSLDVHECPIGRVLTVGR
jgi:hypothetical protein